MEKRQVTLPLRRPPRLRWAVVGGTRVKNQRWQGGGSHSVFHLVIPLIADSPNILHEYVGCIKDFLENKGKD